MATCSECIASDGGCCVSVFAKGWKIVLLPSEVNRISAVTGQDPARFVDTSPLAPVQMEFYCSPQQAAEDPLWARLFSLWTRPGGLKSACPFLVPDGCSLPYWAKPFLCQVYPLQFSIAGNRLYSTSECDCPLAREMHSEGDVLAYFHDGSERLWKAFVTFQQEFIELLTVLEGQ